MLLLESSEGIAHDHCFFLKLLFLPHRGLNLLLHILDLKGMLMPSALIKLFYFLRLHLELHQMVLLRSSSVLARRSRWLSNDFSSASICSVTRLRRSVSLSFSVSMAFSACSIASLCASISASSAAICCFTSSKRVSWYSNR